MCIFEISSNQTEYSYYFISSKTNKVWNIQKSTQVLKLQTYFRISSWNHEETIRHLHVLQSIISNPQSQNYPTSHQNSNHNLISNLSKIQNIKEPIIPPLSIFTNRYLTITSKRILFISNSYNPKSSQTRKPICVLTIDFRSS